MKLVTSTEFRNNQRHYFEKSKKEGVVFLVRGGEVYTLKPTNEIELYYSNPKVRADIKTARKEIANGESYEMKQEESLGEFMNRMKAEGNV